MRHAVSSLNEKMRLWKRRTGFRGWRQIGEQLAAGKVTKKEADAGYSSYLDTILDRESKDARLSADGVEQAIAQRPLVAHLGISHALVSPLRRAVQTALLACSGGDANEKVRLVFMPCLRE